MEPIHFPESNITLQRPASMTDEECGPLSVHNDGETSISCWKASWKERLSILFFGKVWLYVVFGRTQPPVALWGTKSVFEKPQPYRVGKIKGFFLWLQKLYMDARYPVRVK